MVRASGSELAIDGGAHLARLEDQLGAQVELRGRFRGRGGAIWLSWRGVDVQVEDIKHRPGFDLETETVVVRGRLDRARLPVHDLDERSPPALADQWLVRDATLAPSDPLLSPELADDVP